MPGVWGEDSTMKCPRCKSEMELVHKVSEYFIGGTPFPEDNHFMCCPECGEEIEIMS